METRSLADPPRILRSKTDSPVISGYAAVFYDGRPSTEFRLGPQITERINRQAFDRAIREDDVRALFNHDSNLVLGRTPRTLRLSVDKRGLRYEIDADTTLGRQVAQSIERGDISGSSFGFEVDDEHVEGSVRELRSVKLYDISPVTYPAYEATETQVRAACEALTRHRIAEVMNSGCHRTT